MAKDIKENQLNETKEYIFRTAARLFANKGYNGVSMREISEESGVTKPTIYYYFGSKEGIYRELFDAGISKVFSSIEHVKGLDLPAKEKLVVMTKNLFGFAVQYPEYSKFFMTIVTPFSDNDVLEKFKKEAHKRGRVLIAVIKEGIKSGEFGAGANPELAARIIGGVWQHMIMQQLASTKRVLTDKLAEDTIEIIFKGLNE